MRTRAGVANKEGVREEKEEMVSKQTSNKWEEETTGEIRRAEYL